MKYRPKREDPFLYRGLIVYMIGDVTMGAGLQFLHRAREIPLLVDFATLRAQLYGCLQRVMIPEAVVIQLVLLMMSSVLLKTC